MSKDLQTGMKRPDRAQAIARVLEQNILTGHYVSGDRLPSEADLCRHFTVSRPTLREALGRLSALGLIQSRRGAGGGAFVTRPEPQDLRDRIATLLALGTSGPHQGTQMLEARLQLMAGCARLAAIRRAPIDDLRIEIDNQSDFTLDDRAFRASCRRMYLALAQAAGNPVLSVMAQALIEAEAARAEQPPCPTRVRARYLSFHVRLTNGIGGGRVDDCDSALADLLAYEREQGADGTGADASEIDRPPRMRDLRVRAVQHLGPGGDEG